MTMRKKGVYAIGWCLLLAIPAFGYEVEFKTFEGETFLLELSDADTTETVKKKVEQVYGVSKDKIRLFYDWRELARLNALKSAQQDPVWVEFMDSSREPAEEAQVKAAVRDYWQPLTPANKKDLAFIVKTLAYKPLTKIWKYKGSLEYAGSRLENLHPLNFLYGIFGDEELKVGIRNVRKRGWVWSDFFSGIKRSMTEESAKQNLTEEQVRDFAEKLSIDQEWLFPHIANSDWLGLVDTLIQNIPREGDPDRYGM